MRFPQYGQNFFSSLFLCNSSINPAQSIPAGSANTPIPNIEIIAPKNFPTGVIGYVSP